MKFLITGICGFAGSRIAAVLRREFEGAAICGIDNFLRPGSETNRPRLKALGVDVRHGDVRLQSDWDMLPATDWLIDAAAEPSVLAGVNSGSTRQLIETNLGGTVEALEYAKRHSAGFILISTSRVYSIAPLASLPVVVKDGAFTLDTAQPLPHGVSIHGVDDEFSTAPPISLYGSTKLASEALAAEYAFAFQLPGYINRCGVLSGAGQFGTAAQGIFAYWINAHLRRRGLRYIGFDGMGHQSRDVLHIDDLAALIARQIRNPRPGAAPLYTVGGGQERTMSLRQLTQWCEARFGHLDVASDPKPRPYDIPWFVTDSRRVMEDFEWAPQWSLEQILDEIAEHAREHPQWLEWSGAQ
ncbi:MAG TPA: NAD-dependent epimerase/dehydratase family protein [Bryobacteraceae bacterium]|jgi:CDP-paratose 2-epimerase